MLAPFTVAQTNASPEATKVLALEAKLSDCYKQRKLDVFASLLDDDVVITFENGNMYGKIGYLSYSSNTSIHIDVADMSDLKIRMHTDVAVLTGSYHERGDVNGQAYDYHDRFTDVWMKKSGKWLLIASHYAVPGKQ
jgi:hypothetical protein